MHSELLTHATEVQIKEFASDVLAMLKVTNEHLYETLEWHLYCEMYGCHFSDMLLKIAFSCMQNSDGTHGAHWSLEQTNQVAKQQGIAFDKFNQYDWCYVMNMMYSDYYAYLSTTDVSMYVKLSRAFLEDADAPEGKALRYYKAMHCKESLGDI